MTFDLKLNCRRLYCYTAAIQHHPQPSARPFLSRFGGCFYGTDMNATNFQQLIPGQATNFSNLFELSNTSFSVLERLVKLNIQVLKTALAENQVIWETALASKSPQELIALSANTAKASAEKAAIYGRQVQEIFSGAQSEATAACVKA